MLKEYRPAGSSWSPCRARLSADEVLARKVSPTRIAHIVNQKAGRATQLEQIAEFERK